MGSAAPRWPLVLLFVTLSALCTTAPADAEVSVGAVVGVNRCGISGDAPPDAEYTKNLGLIAGVQGEFRVGENVYLALQPMYVRRGSGVLYTDTELSPEDIEIDVTFDYVAVPVVARFALGQGRTFVTGGFDVAFLTAATISGLGVEVDAKDSFHNVDVGALLGFGAVFPIGRPRLTTELRYVLGMSNLSGEDSGGTIENLPSRYHSTGLQLTVGILFPLGRP